MGILILLGMAVLPALLIAYYVYWRDQHEPEPHELLVYCFLFGVVSTVPAIILETIGGNLGFGISYNMFMTFIYAFGVVAFSEELVKYVFLFAYIYPKDEFCEPMDGIVYAVMISMGFAALENILYVMGGGVELAILRAFTAVPAHAAFAVFMGYYVGLAKFDKKREKLLLATGLLSATAIHGAYDFFIFQQNIEALALLTFVVLIGSIVMSFKLIKQHQENSPHNPKNAVATNDSDNDLDLFEHLNDFDPK
ncbi:MAG: PrsW family intramembrane metalloprotease [Aureispira sp.]|nr:PrsW family intramembrane metalloprotease [Aureispira sp.]